MNSSKSNGCEFCNFSGVDEYLDECNPCEFCSVEDVVVTDYVDSDDDTWFDIITKVKAKYSGGKRNLEDVNCIVIHRLSRGRGESGPKYVSNKYLDRQISWHVTIHNKNFARNNRSITQHLPFNEISWNAGNRKINKSSISIEFDAALDFNPHSSYDDESIQTAIDFIVACKKICPNLKYIIGHHDIIPSRRVDPGRRFPWQSVCEKTGLERIKNENLSDLY